MFFFFGQVLVLAYSARRQRARSSGEKKRDRQDLLGRREAGWVKQPKQLARDQIGCLAIFSGLLFLSVCRSCSGLFNILRVASQVVGVLLLFYLWLPKSLSVFDRNGEGILVEPAYDGEKESLLLYALPRMASILQLNVYCAERNRYCESW